jgi:Cdc6-like AAA superfamily ATPase
MVDILSSRFDGHLDRAEIERKVTVRPAALDIGNQEVYETAEMLKFRLSQIYLPNNFSLDFISEMIGLALLYSRDAYSNEHDYLKGIYECSDVEVNPICLTGLAGVGKSMTIQALSKAMPQPASLDIDHFTQEIEVVSHWYASARGKAGCRQIFLSLLKDSVSRSQVSTATLLSLSRRRAWRDGVALLILEELQHVNSNKGTVLANDILMNMSAIGPPFIYVSNYSLIHKLMERNNEDKQRLLSDPRIMFPDEYGSQDWTRYVAECVRVANGLLPQDIDELAHEIYRSTFGIKRLAVFLIKIAYLYARAEGRDCIRMDDLLSAYHSPVYFSNKKDVEKLLSQAAQNRRISADLWCPFGAPRSVRATASQYARSVRDRQAGNKAFVSSLGPGERKIMEKIQEVGLAEATPVSQPVKGRRASRVTKQSLVDAFNDLAAE